MPDYVLGIHSNITDGSSHGGSSAGSSAAIGGHAWISVTAHGATTCYGLWPDDHPAVADNGSGSDIRTGLERISQAKASRYYTLTDEQYAELQRELSANVTWRYTHNCSSWASDVVGRVVGEDVNADDWMLLGAENPRTLGQSIQQLETKDPTTVDAPYTHEAGGGSSSSSSR